MTDAAADEPDADSTEPEATPLLRPAGGVPKLSVSSAEIAAAAELLSNGHGLFAVDAERA
jgi:ribonuclease D